MKVSSVESVLCFGRQLIRSRHRRLLRTWHNVRVTSLCGLLTLVVLRSYLGAGKLVTPLQDYYDVRDHLHSFKLRDVQHKLLLRRFGQLTKDADLLKDAQRSTLSVRPLEESYRSGQIFRGRNPSHIGAVFPSSGSLPATPRPHILLVTGHGSPSCADATEAQFLLKMLTNKMDYCRLHGIEVSPDAEVTSASSQARLLHELMVSHPQVEWIWWMDSLAVFTNLSYQAEFERYAGYDAVIHAGSEYGTGVDPWKDTAMVAWDRMWEGGSFLMRNCDSMRNFLANAGRQTEAVQVFMERTRMGRNEEGEGEAWPSVMHLGPRCGLCGMGNKEVSCVTEAERALNHAERSQKKLLSSS